MLRTLILLSFLALVGYGFYSWATGGLEPGGKTTPVKTVDTGDAKPDDKQQKTGPPASEAQTQQASGQPARVFPTKDPARALEPLVIPDGRIGIIEFVDLSAQRPGKILMLGVEIPGDPTFDPVTMRREKVSFL